MTSGGTRVSLIAGYAASLLALASAAVTGYWTSGGTRLLTTLGGRLEEAARSRSAAVIVLGVATVGAKIVASLVALAVVRPWGERFPDRVVALAGFFVGGLLALYGFALVAVGALVLTGLISPSGSVDRTALRWHVLFWDMWFLLWGLLLVMAVQARPRRPIRSTAPGRGC